MGAKVTDPAVLQAIDAAKNSNGKSDPQRVTLSTGVVLRVKAVPRGLFADILARFPAPPVPVLFIAEKGREEENPNDPDYLTRLGAHNAQLAKAMSDALIVLGTTVESVPENVPGQDDPEFREDMVLLGYDLSGTKARYLAWVKFKAAETQDDFDALWKAVGRLTGVVEDDVSFRRKKVRSRA